MCFLPNHYFGQKTLLKKTFQMLFISNFTFDDQILISWHSLKKYEEMIPDQILFDHTKNSLTSRDRRGSLLLDLSVYRAGTWLPSLSYLNGSSFLADGIAVSHNVFKMQPDTMHINAYAHMNNKLSLLDFSFVPWILVVLQEATHSGLNAS